MAYAFIDVEIGEQSIGRIVIQLFDELAPKACINFLSLCKGTNSYNGTQLSYKGNRFHRVIRNFMIQAGDIVYGNGQDFDINEVGKGGISIYAQDANSDTSVRGTFEDENLGKFDRLMTVAMANAGADTNCSQFFINTNVVPHLDGKHTIFGKVVKGKSVVREIENLSTDSSDIPTLPAIISNCGEWEEGDEVPIYNACYDSIGGDIYEEYPDDEPKIDDKTATAFEATNIIKESATLLFKAKEKRKALLKYKKALRYCNEFVPDVDSEPVYYERFLELKKKLFLNLSLACMNLKEYPQAIKYCDYILEMTDLLNLETLEFAKTYYRRGVSYSALQKYDNAINDLKKAKELSPHDQSISLELAKAEDLFNAKKAKAKANLSKFFN